MKFKRSSKSAKQKELTSKFLKDSVRNETTKINVDILNANGDSVDFLYKRYSKLDSKALKYKLENEKISSNEKKVIKKILNERDEY